MDKENVNPLTGERAGTVAVSKKVKLLSSLTNPPHIWPSRPPKALSSPRNARQAQKANRAKR